MLLKLKNLKINGKIYLNYNPNAVIEPVYENKHRYWRIVADTLLCGLSNWRVFLLDLYENQFSRAVLNSSVTVFTSPSANTLFLSQIAAGSFVTTTKWVSYSIEASNRWIGFDFGAGNEVEINQVLFWETSSVPITISNGSPLETGRIEYSDDGNNWITYYNIGPFTTADWHDRDKHLPLRCLNSARPYETFPLSSLKLYSDNRLIYLVDLNNDNVYSDLGITLAVDGDRIQQINQFGSYSATSFIQTILSNRPIFKTNGHKSLNYMVLSGEQYFEGVPFFQAFGVANITDWGFFIVYDNLDFAGTARAVWGSDVAGAGGGKAAGYFKTTPTSSIHIGKTGFRLSANIVSGISVVGAKIKNVGEAFAMIGVSSFTSIFNTSNFGFSAITSATPFFGQSTTPANKVESFRGDVYSLAILNSGLFVEFFRVQNWLYGKYVNV